MCGGTCAKRKRLLACSLLLGFLCHLLDSRPGMLLRQRCLSTCAQPTTWGLLVSVVPASTRHRESRTVPRRHSLAANGPAAEDGASTPAPSNPPQPEATKGTSWLQNLVGQNKLDRERLAKLGLGAFCAYGVISNVNAAVMITIAWITVVRSTGQLPFATGVWPKFLAIYAGLWVTSNFLRPFRLSLALAAAPFFDMGLNKIHQWTGLKNTAAAFGVMLLLIAAGTISVLAVAIVVCGGIPLTAASR